MALVLKDFWAPWCQPCKTQSPIIKELEKEYQGKVKFEEINVDEEPEKAADFGVMSIPTLILQKDGKTLEVMVGLQSKGTLKSKIEAALK